MDIKEDSREQNPLQRLLYDFENKLRELSTDTIRQQQQLLELVAKNPKHPYGALEDILSREQIEGGGQALYQLFSEIAKLVLMSGTIDANRYLQYARVKLSCESALLKAKDANATVEELVALFDAAYQFKDASEEIARQMNDNDPLTKLRTRKYYEFKLEDAVGAYLRDPTQLFCVAFIDLNNFKTCNDMYGHAVGDVIIRQFSKLVSERQRSGVARWGGDEFAIVLNNCNPDAGMHSLERLAHEIDTKLGTEVRNHYQAMHEACPFEGIQFPVTTAIGVSCPVLPTTNLSLYERAMKRWEEKRMKGESCHTKDVQVIKDAVNDAVSHDYPLKEALKALEPHRRQRFIELLKDCLHAEADHAMYIAKASGKDKSRVAVFDPTALAGTKMWLKA